VRGVFFALLMVLLIGNASSEETSKKKPVAKEQQSSEQKECRPSFDTSALEKAIRESIKEASEKPDTNANEILDTERKLVEYTEQLAQFTKGLVFATLILAGIAVWQGVHLRRTVDAAIRGERPYLFPGDLKEGLLPSGADALYIKSQVTSKPWVTFLFHNIGRTPAILERWCTVLYLGAKLPYPAPIVQATAFEAKTPIRGGEWYPPGTDKQFPAGLTCEYERSITETEVDAIKKGELFFFLYGYVIYRDFFGFVHEKRFCFKSFLKGLGVYGGEAYNYEKSKRIPKERLWLKYLVWRLRRLSPF